MQELKRFVINLKSLDQDISDAIVVGAGDANGRTLAVILTQEAAARFTPSTRLYLSWKHNETNIEGLDVFTKVSDKPATWEIKYPQEMLYEGQVLACLKIIDEISIDCSCNFLITVLSDPNSDDILLDSENYTAFKKAALELNNTNMEAQEQLKKQQKDFVIIQNDWEIVKEDIHQEVGELPEGVTNYVEYVNNLQIEQDKKTAQSLNDNLNEAKKYVDAKLEILEY